MLLDNTVGLFAPFPLLGHRLLLALDLQWFHSINYLDVLLTGHSSIILFAVISREIEMQ